MRGADRKIGWGLVALLLVHGVVAAGCGSAPPPADVSVSRVASVDLSPVNPELFVGGSLRLEAYPTDSSGMDLEARRIRWWSGDEKVATVNSNGLVYGVAVGKAVIAVEVDGVQAAVLVRVLPAPIGRVMIEPEALDLLQGRWTRLKATALDIWGQTVEVESFEWSSSDPAIAQVDGEGRVDALEPGSATIFASVDEVEGSAPVLVRQNPVAKVETEVDIFEIYTGRSRQLVATALDQEGNILPDVAVTWHSPNPQVASVDRDGLVRAWRPGTVKLEAAAGSVTKKIEAVVLPMEVVRVDLPQQATVVLGDSLPLAVNVIGSDGDSVYGKVVHWDSSDPDVATVDGMGLVSSHAIGEATISATVEGITAACDVIVERVPPFVVRLEVEKSLWLREGQSVPFPAVAISQYGEPMENVFFSYSSDNPSAVTVHGGVAYGWMAGTATITTTARSVTAKTTIGVLPALEVEEVEILFDGSSTLLVGETRAIAALVHTTDGNTHFPWPLQWTSSDPDVVVVEEGEVRAVGGGEAAITASTEGVEDQLQLRVEVLRFQQVDAADGASCGLTQDGRIYCWGNLQWMTPSLRPIPTLVPTQSHVDLRFRQISVGNRHLCAIATPGDEAFCIGSGSYGQLGSGQPLNHGVLLPVAGGLRFRQIDAGARQTCGVTLEGAGHCWGQGALGAGETIRDTQVPTPIAADLALLEIRTSSQPHLIDVVGLVDAASCGITTEQKAYCWGLNGAGELGNGGREAAHLPTAVGGGHRLLSVLPASQLQTPGFDPPVAGHSCGLDDTGAASCWGWNGKGQLGDGTVEDALLPRKVAGSHRFRQLAVSTTGANALSCGVTTDGDVLCWGSNPNFVFGDREDGTSRIPMPIAGGHAFTSMALGSLHACGLDTAGLIRCWGRGTAMGIPSPPHTVTAPTPVFGQLPPAP